MLLLAVWNEFSFSLYFYDNFLTRYPVLLLLFYRNCFELSLQIIIICPVFNHFFSGFELIKLWNIFHFWNFDEIFPWNMKLWISVSNSSVFAFLSKRTKLTFWQIQTHFSIKFHRFRFVTSILQASNIAQSLFDQSIVNSKCRKRFIYSGSSCVCRCRWFGTGAF